MLNLKRIGLVAAIVAVCAVCAWSQGRSRVKTAARVSSKVATKAPSTSALKNPNALWINFNGGEDVKALAHDDKNVYVVLAYSKRMVVINKKTGKISQVNADQEIVGVAVAKNRCYYCLSTGDVYLYNTATGEGEGPLFGVSVADYFAMTVSPNGKYIYAGSEIVDVELGKIVGKPGNGFQIAVNDIGGVYQSDPSALYVPFGGNSYKVSGDVVHDIYPDALTGNTFWCCEEGVGYTPVVPEAGAGIKRVLVPDVEWKYLIPHHIARVDNGNLVITTNKGIIFGGKSLEEPGKLVERLQTDVKNDYGHPLSIDYFSGLVMGDGQDNIVFGNMNYACLCIYNPNGLSGYSELKGKAVRF